MKRFALISATTLVAAVLLTACAKKENPEPQSSTQQQAPAQQMPQSNPHAGHAHNSAAGVTWTTPEGWASGEDKPMRVATYLIDAADPKAECAVFYFGSGQGGDVDANITRWIRQVAQPDGSDSQAKAKNGTVTSPCCEIRTIEVEGTYMFSAGPMMQVQEERPDYVLIGGIVPAPEGNVFFKLTGPKAKADQWRASFTELLKSISKSTS